MTHQVVPTANILVINNDRILMTRRANTGYMDGWLCPPGGHIEKGEAPLAAALRETREELGVAVDQKDMEFLCVAPRNTTPIEYVAYVFAIFDKNYDYTNAEPDKCSGLEWVDPNKLPKDVVDDFRQIITECLVSKIHLVEVGYASY